MCISCVLDQSTLFSLSNCNPIQFNPKDISLQRLFLALRCLSHLFYHTTSPTPLILFQSQCCICSVKFVILIFLLILVRYLSHARLLSLGVVLKVKPIWPLQFFMSTKLKQNVFASRWYAYLLNIPTCGTDVLATGLSVKEEEEEKKRTKRKSMKPNFLGSLTRSVVDGIGMREVLYTCLFNKLAKTGRRRTKRIIVRGG